MKYSWTDTGYFICSTQIHTRKREVQHEKYNTWLFKLNYIVHESRCDIVRRGINHKLYDSNISRQGIPAVWQGKLESRWRNFFPKINYSEQSVLGTVVNHRYADSPGFGCRHSAHALQWRHMGAMASQITSLSIAYATIHSGADQRKHQSSASPAFVWGIHRWPVNSPRKRPVTRKNVSLLGRHQATFS